MTTTRFTTISGALVILYISALIIGGFNPFHWFSTIPLIAICVMLFMKLNNDANRNSLKAFKAEIGEYSEDLKWLQDKKADLKLSNINKRLNASKIEELDQAIEKLLHATEEPNLTIEESDQAVKETPTTPEQPVEKLETISTPIPDADLLRVAYTMWRVHETNKGSGSQKDFITKFLRTFGAEYNYHDKLSKSFDVKNETILDKMVTIFEEEKEKRAQKS
ncbi:MAG: hypothetical protein R3Y68_06220 [Rikenellaceae bacterium]